MELPSLQGIPSPSSGNEYCTLLQVLPETECLEMGNHIRLYRELESIRALLIDRERPPVIVLLMECAPVLVVVPIPE